MSNKQDYPMAKVLDHGFIRLVDYMGGDEDVVEAARLSYKAGTKMTNDEIGLINYLLRHKHETPFEMVEFKFHIKMPIFVARQWIRHRTANVNEQSARYSILANEFYVPQGEYMNPQSKTNKQGRSAKELPHSERIRALQLLKEDAERSYTHYEEMLNERIDQHTGKVETIDPEKFGLARELARMNLSLNFYTEWYWKCDLRNLFNFLRLRMDSHAQYEIRIYANELGKIVQALCPWSWNAFEEYILYAETFSRKERAILKQILEPSPLVIKKPDSFSQGEFQEFLGKLDRLGK